MRHKAMWHLLAATGLSVGHFEENSPGNSMFVAIYRWRVQPDREQAFVQAWTRLTELIFQTAGSLGSRLHRCDDGTFLAYAQWPDRELWEKSTVDGEAAAACRGIMRESATELTPDLHLEVIVDTLSCTRRA